MRGILHAGRISSPTSVSHVKMIFIKQSGKNQQTGIPVSTANKHVLFTMSYAYLSIIKTYEN